MKAETATRMKCSWWICFLIICCDKNFSSVVAIVFDPKGLEGRGVRSSSNQYFAVRKVIPTPRKIKTFSRKKSKIKNVKTRDSVTTNTLILPYSKLMKTNKKKQESQHLLPLRIPVLYTNHPQVVQRWLEDNLSWEGSCGLGFDVESVPRAPWIRPNFLGPATVQLATPRSCLVIQMVGGRRGQLRSEACVPILEAVLSDETIIKTGCGIDKDMIDLHHSWNERNDHFLDVRSRLDLGQLNLSTPSNQPHLLFGGKEVEKGTLEDQQHCKDQPLSLKKLTQSILGMELKKSKRIIVSDWSNSPLSDAQLAYSALDAWVAAAILEQLASYDPINFQSDALVQQLQTQPSMKEIMEERLTRRRSRPRNKRRKQLLNKKGAE